MRRLLRSRYGILSVLVLGLISAHILAGGWVGDFWKHTAAVRELATHPFDPQHPMVLSDAPNRFLSLWS